MKYTFGKSRNLILNQKEGTLIPHAMIAFYIWVYMRLFDNLSANIVKVLSNRHRLLVFYHSNIYFIWQNEEEWLEEGVEYVLECAKHLMGIQFICMHR